MRILMINNYFSNTGGADVYTYAVGKLLRENGHEVFFFATDEKPYFEENYEYSNYFPRNINYKSLSKLELIKHNFRPFYNFEAESKLNNYLKLIKPDIVHCNCIFFNLSPSVLNACYKNNIPVVMTLHGPQLMCPSVKMMYKSEAYCSDKLCISGNPIHCIANRCLDNSLIKSIGITSEFVFRKIHGLYNRISGFICPSNAILELARMSGISEDKLFLVNNFVDKSLFNNEVHSQNEGYFLFVGRLSREKGAHYLVKAMSKLPKDVKLHIVGTGQEEDNLKAQSLNLPNVEFLGFKSGNELQNEYKNCIATVIPCDWFENFPTTIIESFTYGKPVIGSRIGGIPEMIDDGINGITFEPRNIDELAQAIYKFHINNELACKMGENGRLKAEKHYTPDTYYSKLIQVYNNCTFGECVNL
ncbi:MAG: hypothetical protein A2287_08880 [Candidatus Melainabacteria bacterium RIFOXYA12_FULL_32_12]|nr:MAG: hypothetical protein A2287_08880 [Candidatus Melainabacteria bacterium RIFOXYA12_FULL_32_12]